jgi:hypothetical protein
MKHGGVWHDGAVRQAIEARLPAPDAGTAEVISVPLHKPRALLPEGKARQRALLAA